MENKTVEWLHRADRCVRAMEGIADPEEFVREAKVLKELASRCHLTPVPETTANWHQIISPMQPCHSFTLETGKLDCDEPTIVEVK